MSVRVRLPNPLAALDDRALVARFADDRDQPAFEQVVKRHGGLVFGVCKRAVRDRHLAEDAFQAVFLVLARNPRGALTAASVGGWLFGVARRVGLAACRHERRRERRERADALRLQKGDAPHSAGADFSDLLRVLDEELAALPEALRAALVACFLEEHTQDEAARELGWSLSTLRRRLDRGKELLRARLARRGVALGVGLLAVAAPARAAVPALAPAGAPSPVSAALAAEAVRRGVGAKLVAAFAAAVLATGGVAFGLASEGADAPPTRPAPPVFVAKPGPAPAVAPALQPVEARKWAAVSGRVLFPKDRAPPAARPVPPGLVKDVDMWKPFGPLAYATVTIDPDTRGIANAIVFLRPDSGDRKAEFPADRIHPDLARPVPTDHPVRAAGPHFAPRTLAVRAGDRLAFENRLPVPINVRYIAAGDGGFNVLVGKGEGHESKPLPAMGMADQFRCDIYPWMDGFVWAFDHPYFAVTDAGGRFEMPDVPVGAWRLVTWHEVVGWGTPGRLGTKITVTADRAGKRELGPLTFARDDWPE